MILLKLGIEIMNNIILELAYNQKCANDRFIKNLSSLEYSKISIETPLDLYVTL